MKKINSIIFLLISVCILFCACSADTQPVAETSAGTALSEISTEASSIYAEKEGETTKADEASKDSGEAEKTTEKKQNGKSKTTTKSAKKSNNSNKNTTLSGVNEVDKDTASVTASSNRESIPANQNQTATTEQARVENDTEKTTTEYSQITCDVKIECSVILDNMDNLKAGHSGYVPADGVILKTYAVTLPAGSTAYDALEKACEENKIKINAQKTSYGVYVAGINNIDEKDCGKSSGWVYSVNDVFPQKSCGRYMLSKGDRVVFSYTC